MSSKSVGRIVFVRHGESIWNVTDRSLGFTARFTGWVDVDLTNRGIQQAIAAGNCLKLFGIKPNTVFTSLLKRSQETFQYMDLVPPLTEENKNNFKMTIVNSWRMNERHYGKLTGLSKDNAGIFLGAENVSNWRRSWDIAPPPLFWDDSSAMRAHISSQPKTIVTEYGKSSVIIAEKNIKIPETESLKDCVERVLPLWRNFISPRVLNGETILIVAHANSIRAMLKHIEIDTITTETVKKIHIPSAIPLVYDFMATKCKNNEHVLVPIGDPSRLGIRGRYIASKDILKLHLNVDMTIKKQSNYDFCELDDPNHSEDHFYDLFSKGLMDVKRYSDEGLGKKNAIIITDGKGEIVHANQEWSKLCGFTRDEIIGNVNSFLQGPLTDISKVNELDDKLMSGLPARTKLVNYRKNGNAFFNDFTVIPIYDWLNQEDDTTHEFHSSLKPTHFVSMMRHTPDRFDIKPLTREEIKLRDEKMKSKTGDNININYNKPLQQQQ